VYVDINVPEKDMLMDFYIIYFYQIIKFFDAHSTSLVAFSTIILAVITAYYAVQTRFLTKKPASPRLCSVSDRTFTK
jgi:hypothetical protein